MNKIKEGYCLSLDIRLYNILKKYKRFQRKGLFFESNKLGFAWDKKHFWIIREKDLSKMKSQAYGLEELEYLLVSNNKSKSDMDGGMQCTYKEYEGEEPFSDNSSCIQDCYNCSYYEIKEKLDRSIYTKLSVIDNFVKD